MSVTYDGTIEDARRSLLTLGREISDAFNGGRQPRWSYFGAANGRQYCWTTERMGDGKFASWIYVPFGKGARTGDPVGWNPTRQVHHSQRKAAKARALRLYKAKA